MPLLLDGAFHLAYHHIRKFLVKETQRDLAHYLRNVGCQDQENLMRYIVRAKSLHRKFCSAYHAVDPAHLEKAHDGKVCSDNFKKLDSAFSELNEFLNCGLKGAITHLMASARTVFRATLGRSRFPEPRCGIKIVRGKDKHDATVVPLWGLSGYGSFGNGRTRTYKLRENTAALMVFGEQREVCIVNDIPLAAGTGRYTNKRINRDNAEQYVKKWRGLSRLFRNMRVDANDEDHAWLDCWNPDENIGEHIVSPNTTYKSTLVVPIAANMDSIPDVRKEFEQLWEKAGTKNLVLDSLKDVQIHANIFFFGYFCVDTHIVNYFDKSLDADLGYYLADLLYFYFYIHHLHTVTCPEYMDYLDLMEKPATCSTTAKQSNDS
jgi:hypothetical protein